MLTKAMILEVLERKGRKLNSEMLSIELFCEYGKDLDNARVYAIASAMAREGWIHQQGAFTSAFFWARKDY